MKRNLINHAGGVAAFLIACCCSIVLVRLLEPIVVTQPPSEPNGAATLGTQSLADPTGPESPSRVAVVGLYANPNYAYSVRLPYGLVGFHDPAPQPNHGIGQWLDGGGYLWVDGSYNSLDWQSLEEAVDANLGFLAEDSVSTVDELERRRSGLGNLDGMRLVARYQNQEGTAMIEKILIAIRRAEEPTGSDIVYTVTLRTPETHHHQHQPTLNAIADSFRLHPLP